ncbi:MAG: hypothetical protein D6E12_02675 [Desulfovibrio sp.]|nr:MAG: hypothetical protein D6E12_02675 [Desulfovibrio sp.]
MRTSVIISCLLTIILAATAWATSLPFGVSVGGQAAEVVNEIYAEVPAPVSADAAIVCDVAEDMIIINVFPSDAQGNVDSSAQPAIIMIQGGNTGALNQTMDGQALTPGIYLMNVVAGGATSRVLFTVE